MSPGLAWPLVAHAARDIASALGYAHEHGLIHRDIKSSNIMVTREGDLKVLDFGLAKRVHPSTLQRLSESDSFTQEHGIVAGTIHYLAPDVLRGERPSVWSDIWALGVLIYEMSTGAFPFSGRTIFEVTTAIMTAEPAPPPREIPDWIQRVVAKCLERNVGRRYRSVRDLTLDIPTHGIPDRTEMAMEVDRLHPALAHVAAQASGAA
jgi:serine/threonine-protein kinase